MVDGFEPKREGGGISAMQHITKSRKLGRAAQKRGSSWLERMLHKSRQSHRIAFKYSISEAGCRIWPWMGCSENRVGRLENRRRGASGEGRHRNHLLHFKRTDRAVE